MVYLTRRYRFAAAHRLRSDALSEEANRRVYGKCNNPYGHGHNYVLEVTIVGPVNTATGRVLDLGLVDEVVEKEVLERFDRTNLNLDVDNFRNIVPTTENLCTEIYRLLRISLEALPGAGSTRLHRVRLEETNSNFIEYEGP